MPKERPVGAKGKKRFDFPPGYGDNKIVILVRDPWWIFAYWEIRHDKEEDILKDIKNAGDNPAKYILRVYDVTDINFNGKNAHSHFDIDLKNLANNWYINVGSPDRSWIVDIGIATKGSGFYPLARSNMVHTPRHGMSDKFDTQWMMPEEDYRKTFGLSGAFNRGKSSLDKRR